MDASKIRPSLDLVVLAAVLAVLVVMSVLLLAAAKKSAAGSTTKGDDGFSDAGAGKKSRLIDEGGAEVEARITKFERENTIKACAIIACLFVFVITWDPVVP